MSVIKLAGQRHCVGRVIGLALIAGACGLSAARPVAASPIKGSHDGELARLDAEAGHSWAAYLLAGPSVWSSVIHPAVTPELRTAIWHALGSDTAEANPMVQFLLWKQSLDPERFARFHPHVAPVLDRISSASLGTPTITPAPTTPDTTPIIQPQTLTPTVPEPGPWLLALGMAGWGIWWRRRAR